MEVTCDRQHNDCAECGSCHYRQPLVGEDVEVAHESDPCGHEKESEIRHKEVCHSFDMPWFYDAGAVGRPFDVSIIIFV